MTSRDDSIVSDLACLITAAIFALGLIVLLVRLRDVQVDDSASYNYASSRQSVRRVQTGGARGRIFDREGRVLAGNIASLSIVCDASPYQSKTWDETVAKMVRAVDELGAIIGRKSMLSERDIRRHVNQSLAMPLVVWRNLNEDELARFMESAYRFPAFSCEETEERTYPNGSLAAHLIGYVGKDRGEVEAGDEKFNFFLPEMRGRAGVEGYYDSFLRGVPGEKRVRVDARGFAIEERTVVDAKRGPDLHLTIDARVQRAVETQLKGVRGGSAVIDPRNGEILALASSPTFDLNDFVPTLTQATYDALAKDPLKPLLNRASGGLYTPGSIFKPITALAALRLGVPASHEYSCDGVFELGALHLRCARRWGHGTLDMRHAICESCNPYFCDLGMEVGTNQLLSVAREFGLGSPTGVDLGADVAGVVPDGEWKMRTYREKWYPGDLAQMSIGQGMLLVSPLQMARAVGAIATGYLVTPHVKSDLHVMRTPIAFSAEQLQVVRDGMRMVVDTGGGMSAAEGLSVSVAGKTGTAEIGRGETRRKNAWFVAYAPIENPTVAIAMVIENGSSGGGTTAPKVGAILREIFK